MGKGYRQSVVRARLHRRIVEERLENVTAPRLEGGWLVRTESLLWSGRVSHCTRFGLVIVRIYRQPTHRLFFPFYSSSYSAFSFPPDK